MFIEKISYSNEQIITFQTIFSGYIDMFIPYVFFIHIAIAFFVIILGIFTYRYFMRRISQSKSYLNTIIDSMAEGVITINSQGIILSFNLTAEQIFGWRSDEIIGKSISVLMAEQSQLIYAKSVFASQQEKINSLGHDILTLKKNGSLASSYVSIENAKFGHEDICIVIVRDITQYKATEKALQKSEQQFRSLIANIPGCYVRLEANMSRNVIFVSDAVTDLTGLSTTVILNDPNAYVKCVNKEFIPLINKTLANVIETKTSYTIEYKITHVDGSIIWVWETGRYVTDVDGDCIDAVTLDITERRLKEEKIRHSRDDAQKSAENTMLFMANISHEIRTPLNAVIGFTNLLSETPLNSVQHHYMESVNTAANALLLLLNNILDNIKLERGALELENIDFSLRELFENSTTLFRLKAQEKGIKLCLDYSDELKPFYKGDPLRISQVINNIIANAIKFTEVGKVTVKVFQDNDRVHIAISDTGIGMSDNHLKHIFLPFVQEDASMSRRFGGTGLGMTIVKQLTDLMQGTISIETKLGQGSTFHILLPLQEGVGTISLYPKVKHDLPKLRILAVDDVIHNLELLKILLERQGHQVTLAINGMEAVDLFKTQQFDVVLMDLQMPVLDGLQATQIIRQYEKQNGLAFTPILAVTANVLARERKSSKLAGMNGFIKKPIDIEDLKKSLGSLFQQESLTQLEYESASDKVFNNKKLIDWEQATELWQDKGYLVKTIYQFLTNTLKEMSIFDLVSSNINDFFRAIHKIKGASGNLRLLELYQCTLKIEQYKQRPQLDQLTTMKTDLITIVQATLAEVNPLLADDSVSDTQKELCNAPLEKHSVPNDTINIILQIIDSLALGKLDDQQRIQITQILNSLGQKKILKQFHDDIDNFDFNLAGQLLQALLNDL